ncbi:uncharacterized protein LOC117301086 [Asterias rubens]|uniref:uncharacterized protein LOC117301086 n=1 Tax=Asterias rubens TaxID=7604 RepID=UPI0014557349|nr:uncharacterized protein LOC117301086 [Asterias rubens]
MGMFYSASWCVMVMVVHVCPQYTLAQTTPPQPPSMPVSTSGGVSMGTTGVTQSPSSESFSTSPVVNENVIDLDSVTELELAGVLMDLCTHRHLCRSLGCHFQPFEDFNRTWAAPLCQCDPDCVFFNDCCQDYKESCEPWTVSEDLSSYLTGLKLGDTITCYHEETRIPLEVKKGYYIIATCPNEGPVHNEQTQSLCEHIDSEDLLSTILVSGVKYNLPYRNVYCALCHGEDLVNVDAWPLNIECEFQDISDEALNLLSNSTSNATLSYIRNTLGCIVQPKPPYLTSTILRACFLNVYESCPEGHGLAEACASYTAFVLIPLLFLQSKNPHCASCQINQSLFIHCAEYYPILLPVLFTPYDPPGPPNDSGIPPISIVLDFRSGGNVKLIRQREVVFEEQVACLPNEVFNPFLKTCRKLSCLIGYVLKENECIKSVTPTIHIDQDIVIYIHITSCSSETKKGTQKAVKSCLAGLLDDNDQSLFEQSVIVPETIQANCSHGKQQKSSNAFMIQSTLETFMNFRQKIGVVEGLFCPYLPIQIIAFEIIYHGVNLSLSKCNGRWMSETQFHTDGSGLVYINESDSWYAANQTLQREVFIHEELSSDLKQSGSLQLCLNPDLSCLLETLNSSLFLHDDLNNILTYIPTGEMYSRDQYIETWSGQIQVCSFNERNGTRNTTRIITFFEYSQPQQILSLILNIISMLAALITFITYCVFKELRNHTGYLIMNFVGTLFMAQLFLLFSGVATLHPTVCTTVAVLAHYLLLVNVLWTGVLAFNFYRTFTNHLITSRNTNSNSSMASMAFAWGIPILIILPCLILHLCDCTDVPLWYGNENVCWIGNEYNNIAVVGVPTGVVICANVILFSFTVHGIRKTNKTTKLVHNTSTMQQVKKELIIYIKISSLMGFSWIIGFAAAFTDVILLWYIFIILNSCQGLLVFLSFVCKISIWRRWKTFISSCHHRCHRENEDPASDRIGIAVDVHLKPETTAKTCTTGI